jgi:Aerobic-type carbon monoxide dehydrogenase, middle subunit CoxM/CutM homologs
MQNFNYTKIKNVDEAIGKFKTVSGEAAAQEIRFLAGGTTLLDLMKLEVQNPKVIVDINSLPLAEVEKTSDGGVRIGALVRNSDLAQNDLVKKNYPVLSEALLSGASAQLRNKATTAGNLLQRTRCVYFRDPSKPCNKREPGSGCGAIDGFHRNLAIMGTSEHCIATNPSDMNVALMALEAKIQIQSSQGAREVDIAEFHLVPGKTPEKETVLQPGDLIVGVTLAPPAAGSKSLYLKLRDRASYEFALSSAAVIVNIRSGKIEKIRMAMGGIGTKPWRSLEAEKLLEGQSPSEEKFKAAAEVFLKGARPHKQNAFKVELAKGCLVRALKDVMLA